MDIPLIAALITATHHMDISLMEVTVGVVAITGVAVTAEALVEVVIMAGAAVVAKKF